MEQGYSQYRSTSMHEPDDVDVNWDAKFQHLTKSIISNIQKISSNVHSMQMMVNQLGTPQDTESFRAELYKIQHYTNQLAKDTNTFLKQLSDIPMPSNMSVQRQWKLQKERLARDFSESLVGLQKQQKEVARTEKECVNRARKTSGRNMKYQDDDDDTRRTNQLIQLESPVQSQTALQLEEETNLEMLQEREQAIHQIETDIMEVNHIFKDLALMVHEQGAMIDSIESAIENTSIHVNEGQQQLQKARNYQTASRKKLCIIAAIISVVLVIIIVVLAVQLS